MVLHRWKTFKTDNEVSTITQQANVDHCGVCGETPLAIKEIVRKEYPKKIVTKLSRRMKGTTLIFGIVCLGGVYLN